MDYLAYGQMDPEDVYSIVAYIRTLAPIKNDVPERKLNFPVNFLINTMPKPANPTPRPAPSDTVAYGKYVTTIAGCFTCHTKLVRGNPVKGMEFAGGFEFKMPDGTVVRSANITPDEETGIAGWNKEFFIKRFKLYDNPDAKKIPAEKGKNTIMPWTFYAGMTEEDLGAIYTYLRTVKPVKNQVEKYPMSADVKQSQK
jgi:mono/diheme cytochrome c family protein